MAVHGKNTAVKMSDVTGTLVDITSIGTDATLARSTATADASHFGTQDKEYIPGMTDATFDIKGLFTAAQDAMISAVYDAQAAGTLVGGTITVEYGPQGAATGSPKYTQQCILTGVDLTGAVGSLVGLALKFQRTGGTTRGVYA